MKGIGHLGEKQLKDRNKQIQEDNRRELQKVLLAWGSYVDVPHAALIVNFNFISLWGGDVVT